MAVRNPFPTPTSAAFDLSAAATQIAMGLGRIEGGSTNPHIWREGIREAAARARAALAVLDAYAGEPVAEDA